MWPSLGRNVLLEMQFLAVNMASSLTNVTKQNAGSATAASIRGNPGTAKSTMATKKRNNKLSKGRVQAAFDVRPKSTTASLPDRTSSPTRKLTTSSSAGNVNTKRNVRQHRLRNSQSDAGISKSFQKLTIQDRKSASSAQSSRRSSSAASSSHVCKSLEDVARWILTKKSHNIVVMAGAGISTPSGIPDFRSPGSGLYDNLQQYKIPYPEAIFDIDFFHRDPRPFFTLAKELYPGNYRPNYVHYFVRMLHEKGILLRMYTQNIDGLERMAGIPAAKLVEAHGTFATSTCTRCGEKYDGDDTKAEIMNDVTPICKQRSCRGKVKPDIVFFGEDLPKRFFYYLKDFAQCDLVIVMGTSLEVQPFAGIVNSARGYVPRLLINREAVGPFARPRSGRFNDVAVTGDLVECVQRFARVLGWKKALEDLIKEQEAVLDEQFGPRKSPESTFENEEDRKAGSEGADEAANSQPAKLTPGGLTNQNPRGGFRGYRANSCQSVDALKGGAAKSPLRNFYTVSETTAPLNSLSKSHPSHKVEGSTDKRFALPRLSSRQPRRQDNSNWRGKSSWRSDSSDSSDSSESSSETDSSDS
ncbi:NAD-dependent protein deacetylase sirtuin-3-like [Acanthaster planci]|uniref:NAD-dependent protein deacetylase sirtuin-3-like n=1 Tax=Acanthaster planci TaxID=133434 RepID=A0A8B7XS57_ACAPL|nr:NAD-dependent protein deacetylase sirtuin-3-like [Acanthaster planci]